MAKKEEKQKEDFNSRKLGGSIKPIETKKEFPSISNYNPTPDLMPMREKEVLDKKDLKAKQLVINSARSNDAPLDMGFSTLFNYGKTINPSVPAQKKDTTGEAVKAMQSTDISTSAKGYSDLKGDAPQQELPAQDSKQLMEDARAQKRASFWDSLSALGTGMQGGNYDWQNSRTNKLQEKRDADFKEYKDIVRNNQNVKAAWDAKKNEDLASYVMKLREEAKNEPAKQKQLEIYEQQLKSAEQQLRLNESEETRRAAESAARIEGGAYDYNNRGRQSQADEFSYDDVTLNTGQEMAINEIANMGGNASAQYSSRIRRSVIENLYDKTTVNGKTTLTPKPGAEAILSGLTDKAEEISQISADIAKREKALEKAIPGMGDTAAEEAKLEELRAKLPILRKQLKQLLDGPAQSAPSGTAQTQSTGGKTAIELAIEKANAAK